VVTSGTTTSGQVVHVVGGHWGWGRGPGPFIFFPFLVIGLVILLIVLTRRRRWYGPGGPWRTGYGPWGPASWDAGPYGPRQDEGAPPPAFEEWHRRAHETSGPPSATSTPEPPPTGA
jgi:hypothetical protein